MKQQILLNQASRKVFLLIAIFLMGANSVVLAQTTTFTYQGRLTDGGTPATGNYDLQFALFDSASSGGQIGSTQTVPSVPVSSGVFTVSLDFGAGAFSGANRFLEMSARLGGSGSFTLLAPRQQITATPYAVRSLLTNAADALTGACVGCVQDANISTVAGSKVTGPVSVGSLPAGSASYVQNTNSTQAGSNFNISGNGTANIFNAATQYNIAGNRVLSVGNENTFAGVNAGQANTDGSQNSFFGRGAGFANTTGPDNSFFGFKAGNQNTTGADNAFFGAFAGSSNTFGLANAFFGSTAGDNATGSFNSFFGYGAGYATTGVSNCFFGEEAGQYNTSGDANVFLGRWAGLSNDKGSHNSFVGDNAGQWNVNGDWNTIVGAGADVFSTNLNHATAIGAEARVDTSNTILLGRGDGSDLVLVPGKLQIGTLGTAGSDHLCINSSSRVATCSSSLRYKTNLAPYRSGIAVINLLRPITFNWKEGGMRDLGFGAEDVEKIDPLLVTYNKEGQVEGVKYDRINVVLVNAIKEQQQQINAQQKQIGEELKRRRQLDQQLQQQQSQINSLKKLVCGMKPRSASCAR